MSELDQQKKAILDWAGPGFPLDVREEAVHAYNELVAGRKGAELDYFLHPLVFGTGGLRGMLGNGAGRMNIYTVGRTTVGLCNFLRQTNKKKASLVIAHDSRRMSPEFARTVAGIAASKGLKVHLFQGVTPTPVLSYAIRFFKASGGVVITASHNPPEYNGYKVYLDDGSQLVGDAQQELEACIDNAGAYSQIPFATPEDDVYKKNVSIVKKDLQKQYNKAFADTVFVTGSSKAKKNMQIIYSPLHGTGGPWLPELLNKYGFDVQMVPEQAEPDGEFPTVKFPNPEERDALRMAEELARKNEAPIFLATDPDADRLGAGVRLSDGSYVLLNGNQVGSIMCAYLCEKYGPKSPTVEDKKSKIKWNVLKTIVTTDLQARIATENGVAIKEVLTGFKYIAEQMRLMEEARGGYSKQDRYLFGGEESYGYLPVDFVRDKDSLASALLLCEIMAEVGNLNDYMNQVYLKYGLFLEDLKSVVLKGSAGQERMKEIIDGLRKEDMVGLQLGNRKVGSVLDYQKQTRDGKADKTTFAGLPPSNVLQLELVPEGKLTIRPSGTEPKVKLYASLCHDGELNSLEELEEARVVLEDELASISGLFIARTGLAG